MQKPVKNNSFFNIISNSLKFEDDNSQQNDKEDQANASADDKLDAQLDDLKEQKDNERYVGTTNNSCNIIFWIIITSM